MFTHNSSLELFNLDTDTDQQNTIPPPPSTYSEWFQYNNIVTWPVDPEEINDTKWLDIDIGSIEDLSSAIKKRAPFQVENLDSILAEVDFLDQKVDKFAQCFFGMRSKKTFDSARQDVKKSIKSSFDNRRKSVGQTNQESLKARNMDLAIFPGFQPSEMTILPAAIEGPKLLNNISRLQNFSTSFRKIWKHFFLSEASVCVLQDAFWWVFLDLSRKSISKESKSVIKSKLFDRMANNFVYLFISIPFHAKDHFFEFYPSCLSQAVYSAFFAAFPLSSVRFNHKFRKYLIDLIYEWVSGICPEKELVLKHWNLETLETQYKFSHDSFDEPISVLKSQLSFDQHTFLDIYNKYDVETIGDKRLSPTKKKVSHHVAGEDKLNKILFNVFGQGPFIKHFLNTKNLQNEQEILNKVVTRTERNYEKKKTCQTYNDIIINHKKKSNAQKKKFDKLTTQITKDVHQVNVNSKKEIKKMIKIHNDICKKHEDIKVLSQKIIDLMMNPDSGITGKVFFSSEV